MDKKSSLKRAPLRSLRVTLRIPQELKAMLVEAANQQQLQLPQFIIQASQSAAESVLVGRTRIVLSSAKWREFNAALDSSPRKIPALRKLFKEPSRFQGRRQFGKIV